MSTFGNTTAETGVSTGWNDYKTAGQFTLPENASVSKLTAYIENIAAGHAACHLEAIIYSDSAGVPAARLGLGSEVAVADNLAVSWVNLPFPSNVSLAAGVYWLGFIADPGAAGLSIRLNAAGGNNDYSPDTYADWASDPWGAVHVPSAKLLAVYATYTVVTHVPRSIGSGIGSGIASGIA